MTDRRLPLTEDENRMFLLWEEDRPMRPPTMTEAMSDRAMEELMAAEDSRMVAILEAAAVGHNTGREEVLRMLNVRGPVR